MVNFFFIEIMELYGWYPKTHVIVMNFIFSISWFIKQLILYYYYIFYANLVI